MKKSVKALSMLCGALLLVSPMNATIFAQSVVKDNQVNAADVKDIKVETTKKPVIKEEVKAQPVVKSDEAKKDLDENKKDLTINKDYTESKKEVESTKKDTESTKKEDNKVVDLNNQIVKNEEKDVTTEVKKQLTQEEARQLLVKRNPGTEYIYQGDENTFGCLKEKNLSGYVFLPNEEGDMGFFVDKNTSSIYYFHPSGYLEQIM